MSDFTCRFMMEGGYLGPAFTISRLDLDAAITDALERVSMDIRRRGFELSQDGECKHQFARRLSDVAL